MGRQIRTNNHRLKILLISLISLFLIILSAFFIFLPPSNGDISYYKKEDGSMKENSLKEKSYIEVEDNYKTGTVILSKDISNPVLLICGGGPGIPEYLLECLFPTSLSDYFTVCYFDYRGTSRSYNSNLNLDSITLCTYLKDVYSLTNKLKERFNKDKIYIMGHSFGTYIALNAIKEKPEYYYAYFAQSQTVNQKESEYIAFDYMKEQYKKNNNQKMYNKLNKYKIKENEDEYYKYFFDGVRDEAMHDLGVGTTRKMKSVIKELFFPSLRCKNYTISERINIWKGKSLSNNFKVEKEIMEFDALKDANKIDIPIYFFAGEYDYTCVESLQRKYFELVEAPHKEYFLYKDVAHSPIYEDDEYTKLIFSKINLIRD